MMLTGFDFLDIIFISCDEEGVSAAALGTDLALWNGGIGFTAIPAVINGHNRLNLQLRPLEMIRFLPGIEPEI